MQSLAWIWCLGYINGYILVGELHYELTTDPAWCGKSSTMQSNHSAGTVTTITLADALGQCSALGTASWRECSILNVAAGEYHATICTECGANLEIAIRAIGFTAYIECILQ